MTRRWDVRVAAGLTIALIAGVTAIATAALPFKDSGASCSAPVVSAVNGRRAVLVGDGQGGEKLVAISASEASALAEAGATLQRASGIRITQPTNTPVVACRGDARRRLGYSVVLVGVALLGAGVARSTRKRRLPADAVAAAA
jgi:hypothetical protein